MLIEEAAFQEFLTSVYGRFVRKWVEGELRRELWDITNVSIEAEVLRDREREESEHSRWKYWKRGNHMTFRLTFADGSYAEKTIKQGEVIG